MTGRGLLAALLVAVAAGCAGGTRPVRTIVFVGGPPPKELDLDGPRLAKAREQVRELLGHDLSLSIDAALVPRWSGSMTGAVLSALEAVAQDLGELKAREPAVFAWARRLERVECTYTALAPARRTWGREGVTAELDGGTLKVRVPAHVHELVPRGLARAHLRDGWEKERESRLAGLSPSSVPPADQEAFLRLVTREATSEPKDDASVASPPMFDALPKVLALDARATGAGKEATRAWLAKDASRWFSRVHGNHAAAVRALSPSSRFRAAEEAWSSWALANQAALPEEERLAVLKAIYARAYDRRPGDPRHPAAAFPKIDRFGLALEIVDEWRKLGHPGASRGTEASRVHEHIVCPRPLEGTSRPRAPRCDHDLYDLAQDDPGLQRRLAEAVVKRRDPIFTEQVLANLHGAPTGFVLATFRMLDGDPASSRAALRVITEEQSEGADKGMLVAEARRLFREHPERRGEALYLLVHVDRYDNGAYDWASFESDFGQKIGRAELDAFLAQGTMALLRVRTLWPALAAFPRGPSIHKALERAWADPTSHGLMQEPYRATRAITNALCEERALEDIREVREIVRRFAASRAEHAGPALRLADELDPDACAKRRHASPTPRHRVVTPGHKVRVAPRGPRAPRAPRKLP